MSSLLVPPAVVRGMKILDRSAFTTTVQIPYLLTNVPMLSRIMPTLKKYLLKLPKFKPVQSVNDDVTVYLNPRQVDNFEDIEECDRKLLDNMYTDFGKKSVTLKYENWKSEEILKAILPEDIEIPVSYSLVGHIVHLNLRDVQLPYKKLIGEVFLDSVPSAKTVINKTNTIDTTFRHFAMEILAGEKDTVVSVKEHGFTYHFDFAKVYWNTRLSREHNSLVSSFKSGDVLYDVFAGVGPFAIPAARKGHRVLANDLNPESYKWLQKNAEINKVKNKVQSFNMDGRDFLRTTVKEDILQRRKNNTVGSEHIVMNLPSTAVEFLDVFPEWITQTDNIDEIFHKPPIIHLYCFVKKEHKNDNADILAKLLVEKQIGFDLSPNCLLSIHNVRDVAPSKDMMRVSFILTKDILQCEEPALKKAKIEKDNIIYDNKIIGKDGEEKQPTEDQKCI